MKKLIGVSLIAVLSTASLAEVLPAPKMLDPVANQKDPAKREKILRNTGGYFVAPNSFKGKLSTADTPRAGPGTALKAIAERISFDSQMNFAYEKSAAGDPARLLKDSGAVAAVVVVDDERSPAALIALEDGWAVVNVAKLARNLKTDEAKAKFLPVRTVREVSRCAAILCGGYRSSFQGNILDVRKIEDLDLVDNDGIPMDRVMAMVGALKEKGMTRRVVASYRKACMDGWAFQPTNDIQKAIWDKVHELPSNPIKIKYDPKRDK